MSGDWRETYGSSPAAIRVAEIIQEMPEELRRKTYRRVGTLLMNYNASVKEINECIRNDSLRETLIRLLREQKLAQIANSSMPPTLQSHLTTLVTTIYRRALEEE